MEGVGDGGGRAASKRLGFGVRRQNSSGQVWGWGSRRGGSLQGYKWKAWVEKAGAGV